MGKDFGRKRKRRSRRKCGLPCLPQDSGLLYASYTLVFVPSRPSARRSLRRNLVRNGSQLLHKFQRTRRDGPIAYIVRTNEVSPSDVFEPAEFASVFFFLFLCKKGERKKGSSECGPSMNKFLRPKQERVSQACLRAFFLSEKSTLLRVRGAMPWARIFLFMGGPQKTTRGR